MRYAIAVYSLICLAVFAMYGIDKHKAVHRKWRISERMLLAGAVIGAPGALAGILLFRHKIRKPRFFILVPLILLVELGLVLCGLRLLERYNEKEERYSAFHSSTDADGDGLDDQSDFLKAVKEYLQTKPKYKSKYYAGGYPDDGYGVCTDVIAFGMREAGYDLQELVDKDIHSAPEIYNIETPDKNIDFRRVVNLKVWFARHAVKLPTDLQNPQQWQPGDIVIFKNHIAVISDKRRGKDRIPYILHHYSQLQLSYEEDALEKWGKIYGHYRLSE